MLRRKRPCGASHPLHPLSLNRAVRQRPWLRPLGDWAGCALAMLLGGCHSLGPVGIDPPNRSFDGLSAVAGALPDDGTLDIFLVHGMRAGTTQLYTNEIAGIVKRLGLSSPSTPGQPIKLVNEIPTVTLDGVPVFDPSNWENFQPEFTTTSYLLPTGNNHVKHVNFYRFEYWKGLAYMKCKFIIAPDTRVVGPSARSKYCGTN